MITAVASQCYAHPGLNSAVEEYLEVAISH